MFILSFFRTIKYALKDFVRNFWLSLVTITVLVLTLVTINILVVFNFLTQTSIQMVEEKLDITVFFVPEVDDAQVFEVQQQIESLPQTESVTFVSREERVQEFQKQYEDNVAVTESINEVDENPFGPALVIKAKESNDYETIVRVLDQEQYSKIIEEKDYKSHQEVISKITSITNKAEKAGQIMSVVFALIAILIVFNTIRITIYSRKDEIHVMKTVGAANWFVKFPYLIQGVLYALLAMIITTFVWFFLLKFSDPYVMKFFGSEVSLVTYFQSNVVRLFGAQLLVVVFVNVSSSWFAMGRYLR